jgi:hypothetical protein
LHPNIKCCLNKCTTAKNAVPKNYGNADLPTGTVGAISELVVCAKLMGHGWHVFRCQSPNAPFDLVAVKGDRIRKIEVRTGNISDNGVRTWPSLVRPAATEHAVYYPRTGAVEFYPVQDGILVMVRMEDEL